MDFRMILDAAQVHKLYLTLAFHHFTHGTGLLFSPESCYCSRCHYGLHSTWCFERLYLSCFCSFFLWKYGRNPAKPVGMENMSQANGLVIDSFAAVLHRFLLVFFQGKLPFSAADTRKFLGLEDVFVQLRCWWCLSDISWGHSTGNLCVDVPLRDF